MWRTIFLAGLMILPGGCAYWRAEPEVAVAPDPVMYPAPVAQNRYIPWLSGWHGPPGPI